MADDELVLATSAVDAGIACWDLRSGSERLRHRPCACAPAGLLAVGCGRFLAASQLPDHPSSTSAPIFFFSWDKVSITTLYPSLSLSVSVSSFLIYFSCLQPQVEVRSFPAEPIGPLLSNSDGTFIFGGGSSGSIYLWEVSCSQSCFLSILSKGFKFPSFPNKAPVWFTCLMSLSYHLASLVSYFSINLILSGVQWKVA